MDEYFKLYKHIEHENDSEKVLINGDMLFKDIAHVLESGGKATMTFDLSGFGITLEDGCKYLLEKTIMGEIKPLHRTERRRHDCRLENER